MNFHSPNYSVWLSPEYLLAGQFAGTTVNALPLLWEDPLELCFVIWKKLTNMLVDDKIRHAVSSTTCLVCMRP